MIRVSKLNRKKKSAKLIEALAHAQSTARGLIAIISYLNI